MNKIHTVNQLQGALDDDFSWRLKEIADLKAAVKSARGLSSKTIIGAGVALLYAHWEGFIKSAAVSYLNYVNTQGHSYEELRSCFVVYGVKKKLAELNDLSKAKANVAALDFIRNSLVDRAQLKSDLGIDTESNLKADVFENIAFSLGISTGPYEAKFNFINESLLRRRNKIAHGEYLDLEADDWRLIADETIALMRRFKNDVENAASQAAFRQN